MTNLYLILHKVRGEPAFDIAQRLCQGSPCQPNCGLWNGEQCSEADGWIIPTSGHRAYPYRCWNLSDLADVSDINAGGSHDRPCYRDDLPADWPDHYISREAPVEPSQLAGALAKLLPSRPPVERRF